MSVTLKVTINEDKNDEDSNEEAIGSCGEYTFTQSEITLGRDLSNDIHLVDPKRTISRNHARLVLSSMGARLEDLKARNFTYLNNERLEYGEQRDVRNGDVISIGIFNIEFQAKDEVELTQIAESPLYNPFIEVIDDLIQSFKKVTEVYEDRPESRRETLLQDAIRGALSEIEKKDALKIVAKSIAPPTRSPRPQILEPPTVFESPKVTGMSEEIIDALIVTVRDLIQIPYKFRSDFIGSTMMLDREASYLHAESFEVTKNYFLEATADELDVKQKVETLKKSAEEVSLHQLGMLEGYRAIVHQGIQGILKDIDPIQLEEQLSSPSFLASILPVFKKAEMAQWYTEKITALRDADWAVSEQRVYRPIFVRAYMLATSKR